MSDYTEEVAEKLNDIIEKNIDAHKGFEKAAENAGSHSLANYFKDKASKRKKFVSELKQEVRGTGEEVEDDGSVTGSVHRTWMDVKAFFSADDDESMLEESIRGEKAAVEEYRDALECNLPDGTMRVLRNQLQTIESDLSEIKTLEDIKD